VAARGALEAVSADHEVAALQPEALQQRDDVVLGMVDAERAANSICDCGIDPSRITRSSTPRSTSRATASS
jgi:hypothetical protein